MSISTFGKSNPISFAVQESAKLLQLTVALHVVSLMEISVTMVAENYHCNM